VLYSRRSPWRILSSEHTDKRRLPSMECNCLAHSSASIMCAAMFKLSLHSPAPRTVLKILRRTKDVRRSHCRHNGLVSVLRQHSRQVKYEKRTPTLAYLQASFFSLIAPFTTFHMFCAQPSPKGFFNATPAMTGVWKRTLSAGKWHSFQRCLTIAFRDRVLTINVQYQNIT
jgi:hypothetical protein